MSMLALAALLAATPPASAAAAPAPAARTIEMAVTEKGFEPARVEIKQGQPVHLVVTRKVENTCATAILIKDLGIQKSLPLNKAVAVDFTPKTSGELTYTCGMRMIGGVLVVQQ